MICENCEIEGKPLVVNDENLCDECYHDIISFSSEEEDFDNPMMKSRLDPGGVYNGAGDCIGRISCGCEDAPACGC